MRWWIKLLAALVVLLIIVAVALSLGGGLLGMVRGIAPDRGEPDPMFAQEAEIVTRPPELYPEETQKPHKTLDDYVPEVETPVDKTAQELILEAQAG